MRGKMKRELSEVQKVAQCICRVATGDCVMDEKPKRDPCTMRNCWIIPIAQAAIIKAKSYPRKDRP
jgi:hypothetical protein